jgi:microcystin-dependent protein
MDPIIGEIKLFAGGFAPEGWALCEGQRLPIQGNEPLFVILGNTYGGDAQRYFCLPKLTGPLTHADRDDDPVVAVNYIIAIKGMFVVRQ